MGRNQVKIVRKSSKSYTYCFPVTSTGVSPSLLNVQGSNSVTAAGSYVSYCHRELYNSHHWNAEENHVTNPSKL